MVHFWKLHICVEAKILPEGALEENDRGECCAPFPSKNTLKHTWPMIFIRIFLFRGLPENLPHGGPKTQKLHYQIQELFNLKQFSLVVQYCRFCKWLYFSTIPSSLVSTQGTIFEINTFALKPNICPKGPSERTTEESAAHHVLAKTPWNIPDKWFLLEFSIFAGSRKTCLMAAQKPQNLHCKIQLFFIWKQFSWVVQYCRFTNDYTFPRYIQLWCQFRGLFLK